MAHKPPRVRLPRIEHPDDHPLMPVRRVAALLGCSEMTIRRRIAARQFPAVRIGRKSMVPRSFVEALLAAAEAGQTVVVDEAVEEWAEAAQTQTSPGGIAARRGNTSQAPDGEQSTRFNGSASVADDRGSVPVLPVLGFAVFLLAASWIGPSVLGVVAAAVTVLNLVVGFVAMTLGPERRANAEAAARFAWLDDPAESQAPAAPAANESAGRG